MKIKGLLKVLIFLAFVMSAMSVLNAQAPEKPSSADIYHKLKKLNVLGTALYVAAHPDDENTRMISYLANEECVATAYLSLTRGDGGQNLIGTEIRELLGVIRTQELLSARRIDGGEQFFSRANDFGYSKTPDETFNIWDREQVLADAVWTIRKFRPDVIINRFSTEPGRTHGHHTASAIIGLEAFEAAADPARFPEQLKFVEVWQAKRIMLNASWWFYGSREAFEKSGDKEEMITVDVGTYNPLLGLSYTELAALSRSQHKCQAMGSSGSRGEQIEYLKHLQGEKATEGIFDGIDLSWNRLKGGAEIETGLQQIMENFQWENPGASVADLVSLRKKINKLSDAYWKARKLQEIDDLITACAGLYLEVKADTWSAVNGTELNLEVEAVNRSEAKIKLLNVDFFGHSDTTLNATLDRNQGLSFSTKRNIPSSLPFSQPYWLEEEGTLGMFRVDDQSLRGLPENDPALMADFHVEIDGEKIALRRQLVYKWTDDEKGELYRPFAITPAATINFPEDVYIFAGEQSQQVEVTVRSGIENLEGKLKADLPPMWICEPAMHEVAIESKEGESTFVFEITPPPGQEQVDIKMRLETKEGRADRAMELIQYDHIPTQTVFPEASAQMVKIDIKKAGEKIGYLRGAGDIVLESLEQIGYSVSILDPGSIDLSVLKNYDAIVVGVRAYNKVDRIKFIHPLLMQYVEEGGTLLCQYNTTYSLLSDEVAPYPLKISRDRVTVEQAEMRILAPDHSVLHFPNKITQKDFDGWVQERGLYFPNEWDENYTAIFSANDPGETPKDGSLLVAEYGKGHFAYCTLSLFRELPAGVPGAYRLLANLVSLGKGE